MLLGRPRLHYAWIILAVCGVTLLAAQGVRLAFGAFLEPWQSQFQLSRGNVSLISTLSFLVYGLAQPLVGKLIARFGVRTVLSGSVLLIGLSLIATCFAQSALQLTILYGLIASIGFGGASSVTASVAITDWFATRRGLAFGVLEAGIGAGQLIIVPAALSLISLWDWQTTTLILGILLCAVVFPLLLLLLRSTPANIGASALGSEHSAPVAPMQLIATGRDSALGGVFTTPAFWLLAIPYFICGFTTTGLIDTHFISYAYYCGFTTATTGLAVSTLAGFNVLGSFLSGPIADRFDGRAVLGLLYAVRVLTLVLLLNISDSASLLLFTALFGLVDFATVAPTQLLAAAYFKGRSLGMIFGALLVAHQLGSALGSYLPGLMYDWTGNYQAAFGASIALLVGASALSFLLPAYRPKPIGPLGAGITS